MKSRFIRFSCMVVAFIIIISGTAVGIENRIISDVVGIFRKINVASNEEVRGSAVAIFGDVNVRGKVDGDAVAIFGNVSIDGVVTGNAVSLFGGISLTNKGKIVGDAVQILGDGISEEVGSSIGGARLSIGSLNRLGLPGFSALFLLIFIYTIIKLIIGYILSVIALLIFPQRFHNMADSVFVEVGRKFLIGIMIVIGFYVLVTMLVMVVLGIPFVLLLTPLMMVLGFTGNTAVRLAIGNKIGLKFGKNWSQLTALTIGTLAYGIIDLTIIGKSFIFLAKAIGIGAVIDSKAGEIITLPKMGFVPVNRNEDENHMDLKKKE
ncbi:MAG: hypothetical protein KGZ33_06085 [Alkaliphilus sp.]|nr:hypothetical protein [Alkaliphilus sp.]